MRRATYDLTHEYASKVLKACEANSDHDIARAFRVAMARKLGTDKTPVPEFEVGDDVSFQTRMELFFSELFKVAPVDLDTPMSNEEARAQALAAHRHLLKRAAEAKSTPGDEDIVSMYEDDALSYQSMLDLLDAGEIKGAIKIWGNQDTAARDNLFIKLGRLGENRLSLWLDANR